MNAKAVEVSNFFKEKFSSEPSIYFSPGRINLIGEHVDYNDGFVMPAAIDKGIYYAIALNNTNTVNFFAPDFDDQLSIELSDIKKLDGWKNYVLSVINEFHLLDQKITGFDCVFIGDVPRGSGLSSSAAVEGGLAFALNDFFTVGLDRVQLALLCQRAEHNFPGVNCGIMDQFANLNGKKDQVLMLDCMDLSYEYFPLELNDYTIVLINSKVHHTLASGEYNVRRQRCEEGFELLKEELGVQSFRDIKTADVLLPFKSKMDESVYNCCLFVVEEIDRTKRASQLLQENDLKTFGKLMFETHEGLSKLYEVSCVESDFLVALATNDENVIGARQMGGGFGGCTINLVKTAAVQDFIDKTTAAYEETFKVVPEAYFVQTANGVEKLN